jgi:magnesium-transporting ATPase (P-type)
MFACKEVGPDVNVESAEIDALENDLELVGITGLEDVLQENVQECIRDFKTAEIKMWMLTGDKEETAHSVAVSCGFIDPSESCKPIVINGHNQAALKEQFENANKVLNISDVKIETNQVNDVKTAANGNNEQD